MATKKKPVKKPEILVQDLTKNENPKTEEKKEIEKP